MGATGALGLGLSVVPTSIAILVGSNLSPFLCIKLWIFTYVHFKMLDYTLITNLVH